MKTLLYVLLMIVMPSILTSCNDTAFLPVSTDVGASGVDDPDKFGEEKPGDDLADNDGSGDSGDGNDGSGDPADIFHSDSYIKDAEEKSVDILWVIDDSGSMEDEQQALADNFDSFINDFVTNEIDFKMSIVTTDTHYRSNGEPIPGSIEKLSYQKYLDNPGQFFSDFSDLIQVGIDGYGREKGLSAAELFLSNFGAGFLRQDAHLAIVFVSDEEDQSSKTVQNYVDFYRSMKNSDSKVKISAIVRNEDLEQGTNGITAGGQRYVDAAESTNGVYEELTNSFADTLGEIGQDIVAAVQNYQLSKVVTDPTSVKVIVDGVKIHHTLWAYDATTNSVKFIAKYKPQVGQEILVKYKIN